MSTLLDSTLARLGGEATRTFPLGAVPIKPTYPYRIVSLAPADPYAYTKSRGHSRFRRITLQSFGHSMAGALEFDEEATELLDGYFLIAAGYECGACSIELASAVIRDPDDSPGVVGLTTTLTFTANKEA